MIVTEKWLAEKSACSEGRKWFIAQNETDGVKVVRKLFKADKFNWANWLITNLLSQPQCVKYAVFAAEQVSDFWKDKYPTEYAVWKKWVDDGCPAAMAAMAAARAAEAAKAAAEAAEAAWEAAWAAMAARAAEAAWEAAWAAMAAAMAADKKEIQIKILEYGIKLIEGGK